VFCTKHLIPSRKFNNFKNFKKNKQQLILKTLHFYYTMDVQNNMFCVKDMTCKFMQNFTDFVQPEII